MRMNQPRRRDAQFPFLIAPGQGVGVLEPFGRATGLRSKPVCGGRRSCSEKRSAPTLPPSRLKRLRGISSTCRLTPSSTSVRKIRGSSPSARRRLVTPSFSMSQREIASRRQTVSSVKLPTSTAASRFGSVRTRSRNSCSAFSKRATFSVVDSAIRSPLSQLFRPGFLSVRQFWCPVDYSRRMAGSNPFYDQAHAEVRSSGRRKNWAHAEARSSGRGRVLGSRGGAEFAEEEEYWAHAEARSSPRRKNIGLTRRRGVHGGGRVLAHAEARSSRRKMSRRVCWSESFRSSSLRDLRASA